MHVYILGPDEIGMGDVHAKPGVLTHEHTYILPLAPAPCTLHVLKATYATLYFI